MVKIFGNINVILIIFTHVLKTFASLNISVHHCNKIIKTNHFAHLSL